MKKSKALERILLLAVILMAVVLVSGLFDSSIYGNQETRKPWLEQFESGAVKITFTIAPPDSERVVDARLLYVEENGLVLRLPKDRIKFFPYSNIISVDPK